MTTFPRIKAALKPHKLTTFLTTILTTFGIKKMDLSWIITNTDKQHDCSESA